MRARIITFVLLLGGILAMAQAVHAKGSSINAPMPGILLDPTPRPSASSPDASPTSNGPPLSLTISMICLCGTLLLIFGVMILGFVVRGRKYKES